MFESQLSPAGAFNWSAVKAGAGVMLLLAGEEGAADDALAPTNTISAQDSKTHETRRMRLPPDIAAG